MANGAKISKAQRLNRSDYFTCAFGIVVTLLVLGIFGNAPRPIIFIFEWIAAGICLLSLGTLGLNLVTRFLEPGEQRAYFYHMLCNLVPTVHLLSRLRESPWWLPVG
jgi:hypothetical protein